MKRIIGKAKSFFQTHHVVIVSTIDKDGGIHCSAKGIVGIEEKGKVYIIDLYKTRTYNNLCKNSAINLTAVDEKHFSGFSIKGNAEIVDREKIKGSIIEEWENRVLKRISKRVVNNVQRQKSKSLHPEAKFPPPEYLILVRIKEIVDLSPSSLVKKG